MAGMNAGSPKGREPYGDTGLVVVVRVTPHRGGRESRPQGEGGQGIEDIQRTGGMRNAERRDSRGHPACTGQAGPALALAVPAAVQAGTVSEWPGFGLS